jgi:tetratricopeptide (TPR) repeat protein
VWDRDRPGDARRLSHGDCRHVAVSPDGKLVATGSGHGRGIKVWDAASGRLVRSLLPDETGTAPFFSPDGRWLVNGTGPCWRVADWSEGPKAPAGTWGVAFSPDGRLAAWGGGSGFIPLIDPDSGRELARLEGPHQDRLSRMTFSPDGTLLIGTTIDSACVRVWDLRRIRQGLAELGLDWDAPPYPPAPQADPAGPRLSPLQVEVAGGEQPPAAPPPPVPSADPKLSGTHINRGNALMTKGDARAAAEAYREAIRLDPKLPVAHYNLGSALRRQQDLGGAIDAYREAIRLNPDYAEAHCNLGHTLRERGQFKEALKHLQQGHTLGSQRPDWKYTSERWVRDCEELVRTDAKLNDVLAGKAEPANAAERLAFATICRRYRERYADAARFYAAAFQADPALAARGPAGNRAAAANAAVQAATGRGVNPPPEGDRPALRRQALEWLTAELAAWKKELAADGVKAAPGVNTAMRSWVAESGYSPVRGLFQLAALPPEEARAWQQFWTEVRQVRDATAPKTP